jgi:tetratricopeptide (TPR) repeat protein
MEGLLTESKELLEANLEKQIRLLGETEINTTNAMSELGEIFMETGCYEEATIWLEKAFRVVAPVFGAGHNYSISSCGALGRCYEKQERYTDAVALYKQTMQEIAATKGSDHLALVKLQRWIDWNCDRLALQEEEKEHCVSGQSHLPVPLDCPVYSAIYKPQRHILNIV